MLRQQANTRHRATQASNLPAGKLTNTQSDECEVILREVSSPSNIILLRKSM